MGTIYIVRHGETDGNKNMIFLGHTDIPLNASGLRQVGQLHHRFANTRLDRILCSDLQRTRATAEAIASGGATRVEPRMELREMCFGELEGMEMREIARRHPDIDWWASSKVRTDSYGGESLSQLAERVQPVLKELTSLATDEHVLVVSHGITIRAMYCGLLGLDLSMCPRFRVDLASVSQLQTDGNGATLSLLNDTHHLDSDFHRDGSLTEVHRVVVARG